MLANVSEGAIANDEYATLAESMEETSLYGVGAYFCDRHPDLVDAVI